MELLAFTRISQFSTLPASLSPGAQLEEVELQDGWGSGLDYAFLSPIFDSISKQGYAAAGFEERRLSAALQHCRVPLIALGGMTAGRVAKAAEMGFSGVAVLGAVWQAADAAAALEELQNECMRHQSGNQNIP